MSTNFMSASSFALLLIVTAIGAAPLEGPDELKDDHYPTSAPSISMTTLESANVEYNDANEYYYEGGDVVVDESEGDDLVVEEDELVSEEPIFEVKKDVIGDLSDDDVIVNEVDMGELEVDNNWKASNGGVRTLRKAKIEEDDYIEYELTTEEAFESELDVEETTDDDVAEESDDGEDEVVTDENLEDEEEETEVSDLEREKNGEFDDNTDAEEADWYRTSNKPTN